MLTEPNRMLPRYAVIFRTHFWDDFVRRQFDRLLKQVDAGDVYVLVDETNGPVDGIEHDRVVRITEAELLAMGFAAAGEGNLLWFNGDYPLYRFLELHGGYDYYLQLEYDVVFNVRTDDLVRRAAADQADFVGLTKGEPTPEWVWLHTCVDAYDPAEVQHELICISVFSERALRRLWQRRLEHSKRFRRGEIKAWPFCEGFIATEMALGGFRRAELSDYGNTDAYDHWPPYLEADLKLLRDKPFVHPMLDRDRYIASMFKFKIGLKGYLKPNSLMHRKLRRLPAPLYIKTVVASFAQKAKRNLTAKAS